MSDRRLGPALLRTTVLTAVALVPAPAVLAQSAEDCLTCHSDVDLTGSRDGVEISVFVDEAIYAGSLHGDLDCVLCHTDLEGQDFHDEEVAPVDVGKQLDRAQDLVPASVFVRLEASPLCTGLRFGPSLQRAAMVVITAQLGGETVRVLTGKDL